MSTTKKKEINTSGIEFDDSPVEVMRTTMKLSRDMGMSQKRKKSWPKSQGKSAPAATATKTKKTMPKYSIACQNSVACPNCEMEFEIIAEYYGALAECEDCGCEFTIVPPETSSAAATPMEPAPEPPPSPAENTEAHSFSTLEAGESIAPDPGTSIPPSDKGGVQVWVFIVVTVVLLAALAGVLGFFLLNK